MSKKTITLAAVSIVALFVAFRLIAPTLTSTFSPFATPTPNGVASHISPPLSSEDAGSIDPGAERAIATLEGISVSPPDQTPYDRRQFGQAWADVDRNGCDTRSDILRRDTVDATFKPGTRGCVVLTGVLHDPYTGKTINFVRGQGTSELVQIDHVVPLAWAWRQGAAEWSAEKRQNFANDPTNLLAVDGPTNIAKGDQGPARWMPPNASYDCSYATRFVQVLGAYDLTVTADDHTALQRELNSCTKGE